MSWFKALVSCPHCGNSSTVDVTTPNGSCGFQCRSCGKSFRVYASGGRVTDVKSN